MIRLAYLCVIGLLSLILFSATPIEPMAPEQWTAFGLWVIVMLMIAIVGVAAFKSVWLQDGFAGLNKILEDHEALKFLASIMSFIFLEGFFGLIATSFGDRYPHPVYLYAFTFSGCVGTGGYAIADKVTKYFGNNKAEK